MQSEKNRSCGRLICRDSSQEHLTGATPPLALLAHLRISASRHVAACRTPWRRGVVVAVCACRAKAKKIAAARRAAAVAAVAEVAAGRCLLPVIRFIPSDLSNFAAGNLVHSI